MLELYNTYIILLILSGIVSLNLAFIIYWKYWLKKHIQPAMIFSLLLILAAIWTFASLFSSISLNSSQKYFWEQFKYIGIIFIPPSWFFFSLKWTGRDKWFNKRNVFILYFISLLFLLIIFSDSLHHLIWSNIEYQKIGSFLETKVIHGLVWWIILTYSYILIFVGSYYLLKGLINLRYIYRHQAFLLLLGSITPWITNIIYALDIGIISNIDFTPSSFIFTGLIFLWGFSKFKLIDISPVAKDVVFENMDDPIIVLDANNRIVDTTNATRKILNCEISEIIGKKIEKAFYYQQDFIKFLGENKESQTEVCFYKKEREFCFDMKITSLYDSNNNFNGRIIVLRDITDRKESELILQKSEAEYRAIFENTGTATVILDEDNNITLANKVFQKLSGFCKEKIEGKKNITDFFSVKELEKLNFFIKQIKGKNNKNDIKKFEFKFTDKSGNIKDVYISVDFIPSTKNSVFSIQDITEHKMALNELRDAHELLYVINKDLERKVKDRTIKIEKLIKQKDEFINQLGHDLKTPLTPMMALVPLINEKTKDLEIKELSEVLMRNIYFMRDLVNKTIDLAKLNSDKIEFFIEDTNLLSEVENVIKNNDYLFKENDINVINKINSDIFVKADKLRLNELLNNLIINSMKYTSGEEANVIIDAIELDGFVTISVDDNGIGMTKKEINHIFDEFYKADDSRHNLDSSGLGLPICKRIVLKHGGEIWAESQGKGKGSTFFFTLKTGINIENQKQK